jgi:stage III sporulation protein SpoIIIAA
VPKVKWHAYYFDSLDNSLPPIRTEIIEAGSEDEAGKIATAQMGRCMRVDVTRWVWEPPHHARSARGADPMNY